MGWLKQEKDKKKTKRNNCYSFQTERKKNCENNKKCESFQISESGVAGFPSLTLV